MAFAKPAGTDILKERTDNAPIDAKRRTAHEKKKYSAVGTPLS